MKERLKSLSVFILFILLIMGVIDYNIQAIVDVKIVLLMFTCILMLTFASYNKQESNFISVYTYQVLLTSLFTATLLFLKELSGSSIINFVTPLKPIIYGVLFYLGANIIHMQTRTGNSPVSDLEDILSSDYGLSEREMSIAIEMLKGKSNKAIAKKYFIAESTVKKHVQHILKKADAKNRMEFKLKIDENR
ncbi:LuxR family transcriptional regulator [Fusibacter sp. A1]|nr:helix-turn-helix transcriptional regulator [Fusibacter sp. A1]RXV60368.1 LuxR family transcriptional regulator [Fusibacter sp. A1]